MCEDCQKIIKAIANRKDVKIIKLETRKDKSIQYLEFQLKGKTYTLYHSSSIFTALNLLWELEQPKEGEKT